MANIDKFNDLRKIFFIIYSDIKLNLLKNKLFFINRNHWLSCNIIIYP